MKCENENAIFIRPLSPKAYLSLQSAFVPQRKILDTAIIVLELIHIE